MRLSDDKVSHLSHLILEELIESEDLLEIMGDEPRVRREIKKAILDEFQIEDEIEREARKTLSTYSQKIVEDSREWDIMFRKICEQEMDKKRIF